MEKPTRRQFLRKAGAGLLTVSATSPLLELLLSDQGICLAGELAETESASFWPNAESLQRVLSVALERGAGFADIYLEYTIKRFFDLRSGKISTVHFSIDQGAGIRTLYGERTGYCYCEEVSPRTLEETARTAASLGKSTTHSLVQPLKNLSFNPAITSQKAELGQLPENRRIELMRRAEDAARAYNPAITDVTVEYEERLKEIMIVNSEGTFVRDVQPLLYFRVNALARKGDQRHMGRSRLCGNCGFELFDQNTVEEQALIAAREAVVMLTAQDSPAGEMPVVVNGGWGGVMFHEAVGHGLEGDAVAKNASFFADKIGQKIASDIVTFVDDATLPHLRGTYNYDDEGVPAQRKVLIEKGILKGYMHDRRSAQKLGAQSTGNGRRQSYCFPPLVRMSNTFILEGSSSPEEIIEATPKGLFAKSFDGGVVDTTTGNFTFTVREAYLIEAGKLTRPVRRATLIGKGSDALLSIDLVGNDLGFGCGTCGKGQWVPVTSGQPTLRLSKIVVGGTRG
ncbi:TldD/PmbA family protein [bacterium]|nr:TldD/PmbA family protein [bacterium]